MSCGCDGKKVRIEPHESFLQRPYDSQALEMVQSPPPKLAEATPEKPSTARAVMEYSPQPSVSVQQTPALPAVFSWETPMTGISFGGFLPYNVVAFICPIESISPLRNQSTLFSLSQSVNMNAPIAGFLTVPGLDQFWIARPGEVIEFGHQVTGVCGFFAAPWSGLMPRAVTPFQVPPAQGYGQDGTKTANALLNSYLNVNLQSALAAGQVVSPGPLVYGSSFDPVLPVTGSVFSPTFRAYYGRTAPVAAPWTLTPWVVPNVSIARPNATVCIPPGTRFVTVTFNGGNANNANSIVGGTWGYDGYFRSGYPSKLTGTFDVQVDWIGYDGIAHQHPADQLLATQRGQITGSHDIEVFEVPRNAAGVNVYYYNNSTPGSPPYINSLTYVFSPS